MFRALLTLPEYANASFSWTRLLCLALPPLPPLPPLPARRTLRPFLISQHDTTTPISYSNLQIIKFKKSLLSSAPILSNTISIWERITHTTSDPFWTIAGITALHKMYVGDEAEAAWKSAKVGAVCMSLVGAKVSSHCSRKQMVQLLLTFVTPSLGHPYSPFSV